MPPLRPAVKAGDAAGRVNEIAGRREGTIGRVDTRVAGLVLVGPTVDPQWRTVVKQVPRWILECTREPLSLFPILARDYLRCGTRRFFATGRFAFAHRMEDDLPRVHAPVLVVRGERDAFVSPAWAERVTSLLPNGELAIIAGAPHAATYAAPDAVARLVRTFLTRSSQRAENDHDSAACVSGPPAQRER